MRLLPLLFVFTLFGCEAPVEPRAEPSLLPLSRNDQERVCRAAMEAANSQPASAMIVSHAGEDILRLSYVRKYDGKKWTYDCRPMDGTVDIRPVDQMGPGTGVGTWWSETAIAYKVQPKTVEITVTYKGAAPAIETVVI